MRIVPSRAILHPVLAGCCNIMTARLVKRQLAWCLRADTSWYSLLDLLVYPSVHWRSSRCTPIPITPLLMKEFRSGARQRPARQLVQALPKKRDPLVRLWLLATIAPPVSCAEEQPPACSPPLSDPPCPNIPLSGIHSRPAFKSAKKTKRKTPSYPTRQLIWASYARVTLPQKRK